MDPSSYLATPNAPVRVTDYIYLAPHYHTRCPGDPLKGKWAGDHYHHCTNQSERYTGPNATFVNYTCECFQVLPVDNWVVDTLVADDCVLESKIDKSFDHQADWLVEYTKDRCFVDAYGVPLMSQTVPPTASPSPVPTASPSKAPTVPPTAPPSPVPTPSPSKAPTPSDKTFGWFGLDKYTKYPMELDIPFAMCFFLVIGLAAGMIVLRKEGFLSRIPTVWRFAPVAVAAYDLLADANFTLK